MADLQQKHQDLQQKYQKLAHEYAKIRDEHRVLKAAVISDKGKENQLKELIKERDLRIRKLEQELESLNFRNQQLTRKVEGLQQELSSVESRGAKHKVRTEEQSNADLTSQILQDELSNKIEEITILHKQMNEESEKHVQLVTELQNKLDNFERDNSQNQSVLEGLKKEHQETVERLQEDKARLEIKVQSQEKLVQSSTQKAAECSDELNRVKDDLEKKIHWAMGIIDNKLPFNDTALQELNCFNVPTHDRKHQKKTKDMIGQALTIIKELCVGLSNFHTYTEQRCKIFPVDASTGAPISEVNQKFCLHLHENASYLRPIEQAFRKFYESIHEDTLTTLETAVELGEVATNFSRYVKYHETLLPYQLLSLEEECAISSCPQTLESRNMDVHAAFKKMCSALVAVESYVSLIASISSASNKLPVSNHQGIFEKFAESAAHLSEIMKDVYKSYNFKVSLEHQLPTATQKLKTTDECVVTSITSLVNCTGKLAHFLKMNKDFFATPIEYRTRGHSMVGSLEGRGSSPVVTQLRKRAAQYMASLNRPCPESVPYEIALKEHEVLISSVESKEGMTSQLQDTKEKVNKLTEEKEHWLLEAQLVQMKLDQEKKRNEEMQNQLMQLMGGQPITTQQTKDQIQRNDISKKPAVDPTMLGQLNTVSMDLESSDAMYREQRIKDHYQIILRKEIQRQQESEGQVVSFSAECRAMQKRLGLSELLKAKLLEEQKEAQQTIAKLKDELQVVTRTYKSQIQLMSDHLCVSNDKLASQKDEIDALKLSLKQQKQPVKKNKGK